MSQKNSLSLIPQPNSLTFGKGTLFLLENLEIYFVTNEISLYTEAKLLKEDIKKKLNKESKINSSLKPQTNGIVLQIKKMQDAYSLVISKDCVLIEAPDKKGIFYGIQTFLQIAVQTKLNLPILKIKDSPYFATRGFYHDITRSKVPMLETLKLLVDKISYYKLNQLQLYIEHTFAFKDIPELWIDKDPITAEEILELDEYASKKHVELVPSLSTFGHMYEMLRVKKLEHLNELDVSAKEIKHSLRDRMRHYTLDANNPESLQLVKGILDEFIPLFRSNFFNICCDETFDLGKGKNKKHVEKHGSVKLYTDFLKKIINHVKGHKKTVMFWGDIMLKDPKLISEIPKDTICLNWDYGTNPKESETKTFFTSKIPQILCPGVTGWNNFMNPIDHSVANISKMTEYARKYKALGILNTDWGDMGHVNMLTNSMYGMIFGAACSWSKQTPTIKDFDKNVSVIEWRDPSFKIAEILREMGNYNVYNFRHFYCWLNKIDDPNEVDKRILNMKESEFTKIKNRLSFLRAELLKIFTNAQTPRLEQEELLWSNRMLSWIIDIVLFKLKLEYKKKISVKLNRNETIREGYHIIEEYQKIWRSRNKESEIRHTRDTFIQACDWLETATK